MIYINYKHKEDCPRHLFKIQDKKDFCPKFKECTCEADVISVAYKDL